MSKPVRKQQLKQQKKTAKRKSKVATQAAIAIIVENPYGFKALNHTNRKVVKKARTIFNIDPFRFLVGKHG